MRSRVKIQSRQVTQLHQAPVGAVIRVLTRFLEFAGPLEPYLLPIDSTQDTFSQREVDKKEGKNTEGYPPIGPQSLPELRSTVSRSHPDQDHLDAAPQDSCTRRRKEYLVRTGQ